MIEYPLSGGYGHIPVLVDEQDLELVRQYKWYRSVRGRATYARRLWKEDGRWRPQYMHSLLTGWKFVDHVDHNGLNNTRSNLRAATPGQNIRNSRAHLRGVSPYKGVSRTRKRWKAQISVSGVHYHLGHHDTEMEAALAYDLAARHHFGEWASLNFPDQYVKNGENNA